MTRTATKPVEPAPAPVAPVRLLAPFAFYDDDGIYHSWVAGQLITDQTDIALLRQRGAMVEDEASLQAGPPVGGPRVSRFLQLYEQARARHGHLDGVAQLLDAQAGQFKTQIAQLQRTIDAASTTQASEVQRAHIWKDKTLDEAETFMASWAAMSSERASLKATTLRSVPDRPRPLTRRQALQQQLIDAKAKHEAVGGVLAILDEKIAEFDRKNKHLDYRLKSDDGLNRKRILAEQDAAFRNAEEFLAGWMAKSDEDAAIEGKAAEAIALSKRVIPVAVVAVEPELEVVIEGPSTEDSVLRAYREATEKHKLDRRVTYHLDVHLDGLKHRLGQYQATVGRGMSCPAVELKQAEAGKAKDLLASEKFFTKWLRRSADRAAAQIVVEGVVY